MKRIHTLPAIVLAAGVATAGSLAYAGEHAGADNDAVAGLAHARISLAQAVGAAEAQTGGKATKAELEHERGKAVFEVEVVTADQQVFDVRVDAGDGNVLSSTADRADRGDDDDD